MELISRFLLEICHSTWISKINHSHSMKSSKGISCFFLKNNIIVPVSLYKGLLQGWFDSIRTFFHSKGKIWGMILEPITHMRNLFILTFLFTNFYILYSSESNFYLSKWTKCICKILFHDK